MIAAKVRAAAISATCAAGMSAMEITSDITRTVLDRARWPAMLDG
jgi:hypothetical protein